MFAHTGPACAEKSPSAAKPAYLVRPIVIKAWLAVEPVIHWRAMQNSRNRRNVLRKDLPPLAFSERTHPCRFTRLLLLVRMPSLEQTFASARFALWKPASFWATTVIWLAA